MRRGLLGILLLGGVLLTGCSRGSMADATWSLPVDVTLDASTTSFPVEVERLSCNGGVTGTVNTPDMRLGDDRVVLTFTVTPGEAEAADCQSNERVRYDVTLPEPLGARKLMDGSCELDRYATIVPCANGGLRYPS